MVFADKMHDIIRVLESDGVIVYPTDTIWGIGCSVHSKTGFEKLHAIKKKKIERPFTLLCSNLKMLKKYVRRIHPRVETLLSYHERPLTIVYPQAKNLPGYAIARDGSVAIRIATEPFSRTIVELLGAPIFTTSANVNGMPHPSSFEEINSDILQQADYVCFHNRSLKSDTLPSVVASYDRKGELIFLQD